MLAADFLVPRVASAQLALVEPDIDAEAVECIGDSAGGGGVFARVAEKDSAGGTGVH